MTLARIYPDARQFSKYMNSEGQLISKCLFGVFNSSKKRTKKIALSTMIPQVKLFCVRFLEELKTPKRLFETK